MGMFDSIYDEADNEWQTKAFGRNLRQWSLGDEIHGSHPLPFQVEVFGRAGTDGDFVESFATIRNSRVAAVPTERDRALPLMSYGGDWVPDDHPAI